MNNDEKILGILEQMHGRFDKIEEGQASMQADIAGLKEGQASMQADISSLKEGQAELREDVAINRSLLARMEIEQGKKLQAIIDAQICHEENHRRHELRIVKLEKAVDLLDTKVVSLQAAK